jgi:sporulation protein YlmC with PRC-barrel domain
LLKKPVETVSKEKIGKVSDYAVETTTMYVQKLYVSRSIIRNLTGGGLSIDRSQIVEITNSRIIINDLLQGTPSPVTASIA